MRNFCAVTLAFFFLQSCSEAKPEGYCADIVQVAARSKAMHLSLRSKVLEMDVSNPERGLLGAYNASEAAYEKSRREVFDVCGSEGERFIDEHYTAVYEGKL
jgi:hypothetical protein